MELVLSLFPGIDLFGRAFEQEGYCVVRGPDLLWGQDIRDWQPAPGRFDGIIAGSPCQDYSRARRDPPSGNGDAAIEEFRRVVTQARPVWWLLENVPGVPIVRVEGYTHQLLHIAAHEVGSHQYRRRLFQFGACEGPGLIVPRQVTPAKNLQPCCTASEGKRGRRRTWAQFCEAQGFNTFLALPGWSIRLKYQMVGNGVPLPLGRALARAVRDRYTLARHTPCVCGCGRPVEGKRRCGTAACRKRMQRARDQAAVTQPGPVTPAASHQHNQNQPTR